MSVLRLDLDVGLAVEGGGPVEGRSRRGRAREAEEILEGVAVPPDRDTVGSLTRGPQALSRGVRDFQDEADGKADGKSRLTFAQP